MDSEMERYGEREAAKKLTRRGSTQLVPDHPSTLDLSSTHPSRLQSILIDLALISPVI